jgi:hypothetical protein
VWVTEKFFMADIPIRYKKKRERVAVTFLKKWKAGYLSEAESGIWNLNNPQLQSSKPPRVERSQAKQPSLYRRRKKTWKNPRQKHGHGKEAEKKGLTVEGLVRFESCCWLNSLS